MNPQEFMITMRDDVRLQNFLYRPSGSGPFPALLARCMYGADRLAGEAAYWASQGYAVALQNVRGRHGSEGGPAGRNDFPTDGYDTLDWMAAQPWCTGRIGTIGRSALARVQTATAFLAHPAHRAMAPMVLPYGMMSRLGGALMLSQIPQWMYYAQSGPKLAAFEAVDWMPHLFKLPATTILDEIGGPLEQYRDVLTNAHTRYLSDPLQAANFPALNTPNLMVTGWYDHCATGAVDFYRHTRQYASAAQLASTHLIIGPWDHSATGDAAGEYDFGPAAQMDHRAIETAFFDHHLKGIPPAEPLPPVRIFVMGRDQWRDEAEWPPAPAREMKLYLHSQGDVRGAWVRGSLTPETPGEEPPDHFTYDPADPVPTWGGANSAPARVLPMKRGARDQRITLYRDDVLTFYSTPFPAPLEVTGELSLVLYAASSARDTDFTAKLMDIAPDGNARLLSDGVIRARYRDSRDHPALLQPGTVYRFEIDLWFTSNEFQPGHQIALALSSSNFPRIDRNLNTGGDNLQEAAFTIAHQTIFHDARYPSHLVLPVIPR